MNISATIEKQLSDKIGTIIVENTKLGAIIQAAQEENIELRARIAELEAAAEPKSGPQIVAHLQAAE